MLANPVPSYGRSLMLLGCVLAVNGCFAVRGSGVQDDELRETGTFEAVHNGTSLTVNVLQGDVTEVHVYCDDNLIALVDAQVRGGELRIATAPNTSIQPQADCGVDITVAELDGLRNSGSGRLEAAGDLGQMSTIENSGSGGITVADLATGSVDVESSGSGDIVLEGTATFTDLSNSGSGQIDAAGLTVAEGDVRSSGSGDIDLTVTDHATVKLSGSGDVRIRGDAEVDADDSGSGNVRRD